MKSEFDSNAEIIHSKSFESFIVKSIPAALLLLKKNIRGVYSFLVIQKICGKLG